MRVILRRMESLGGLLVATDEADELDRITIGRGTDQNVQLPDVRVTLAHAEIHAQQSGGFRLECRSENPVLLNGSPTLEAALRVGDQIDCGRFRLSLQPPDPGADLVLQIEERVSAREEKGQRRTRYQLDLAHTLLSKRRLAWGLALLVLVPLLVLPAVMRYAGGHGASLDSVWQAGPPSAAHNSFIQACDTCHQRPFAAVRDEACLACHKDQRHHSDRPELLAAGDMADNRCATCHLEHTGRNALIARSPALCTHCHANPDQHYAAAQLPPVHRFSGDHPGFTLSLPGWEGRTLKRIEVAQGTPQGTPQESGPVRETSHLAFPHDVHLAPDGVGSPEGKRVLECESCHQPMGTGFAPIRMEQHCISCHVLDFDPESPERRLPHRAPQEVAAIILDHYARKALAGGVNEPSAPDAVRLLRRPGQVLRAEEREAAMSWAEQRAAETMEDVFSRRVCAGCHIVRPTGDAATPYQVDPVALTTRYFEGARFDHPAHRTEACSRCHAAAKSKDAADVLVPPLANCRECHADPGTRGLIGTACVDCHGFHTARHTLFGAPPAGEAQK